MSEAAEIQKQIEELQAKLDGFKRNARSKIEKMSAEVKDSNPYSRLMALQRMGIVNEYERIRSKSVAVVGEFINVFILIQLVISFYL
jgi:ubiquitin-like modifier-activating enzyme 5